MAKDRLGKYVLSDLYPPLLFVDSPQAEHEMKLFMSTASRHTPVFYRDKPFEAITRISYKDIAVIVCHLFTGSQFERLVGADAH